MKYFCLIVAAGKSKRFGKNKILEDLNGNPLLFYSLKFFSEQNNCSNIILVYKKKDLKEINKIISENGFEKVALTEGGKSRAESVYNGIIAAEKLGAKPMNKIIVHNGANPFIFENEVRKLLKEKNAILARIVKGTQKTINEKQEIVSSSREKLYCAETPQVSSLKNLKKAYELHPTAPDEAEALSQIGIKVKIIDSRPENFKITKEEDLELAKKIMNNKSHKNLKIGIGEDSHRFVGKREKKTLVLAGLKIPGERGLKANSDGDVIIHSVCNAILSALGKEGSFSLIADKICKKGIKDSSKYLEEIVKNKFNINNISISIEAKKPKLEAHIPNFKKNLSVFLDTEVKNIGITCHSGEGLSEAGKGKGIYVKSVVSLEEENK